MRGTIAWRTCWNYFDPKSCCNPPGCILTHKFVKKPLRCDFCTLELLSTFALRRTNHTFVFRERGDFHHTYVRMSVLVLQPSLFDIFLQFFSLYLPKMVADLSSFLNFFEFWLFPGNQSYCVLLIVMSLFHTRPVSLPGPVWRDGTLLYYLPKNFSQIYIALRRMGVKNWMVHYRYYSLVSEPLQANGTLLNRILRFDATHTPVQPSRFIEPSISCSTFNDQTSQFDWTTFTTALTVISTNKRAFIRVSTFGASLYTTASDWSWWWSSPQVSEGKTLCSIRDLRIGTYQETV